MLYIPFVRLMCIICGYMRTLCPVPELRPRSDAGAWVWLGKVVGSKATTTVRSGGHVIERPYSGNGMGYFRVVRRQRRRVCVGETTSLILVLNLWRKCLCLSMTHVPTCSRRSLFGRRPE